MKGVLLSANDWWAEKKAESSILQAMDKLEQESWWAANLSPADRKCALVVSTIWLIGVAYVVLTVEGFPVRLTVEMFLLGCGALGLSLSFSRLLSIRRSIKERQGKGG